MRCGLDGVGQIQDGVAGENRGFEPTKLGTRLQPQLLDEDVTRPLIRAHRLRLAAGPIQGDHQRRPQPLSQWVPRQQ